jgi:hypothetical protein
MSQHSGLVKAVVIIIVLLLIGAAAVWYVQEQNRKVAEEPVAQKETLDLPEKEEAPPVRYPVPTPYIAAPPEPEEDEAPAVEEEPLPPLQKSDESVKNALTTLVNPEQIDTLFVFRGIIHRFVVTVENLTAPKLPNKFRLTKQPPGKFLVEKHTDDLIYLDTNNYRRYNMYVQLLEALDVDAFTNLYVRYYPLLQEAYDSLGYPDQYFNDRLIEVIDHLLKTPNIDGPIRLVQPKVYYQFADPELEALSAGQKILIRIGPESAAIVKSKLKQLRQALATLLIDN